MNSLASSASSGLSWTIVGGQPAEQCRGPLGTRWGTGRDDLRQGVELLHRLALGDALGAERDRHVDVEPGHHRLDQRSDAGVDGGAQDQQLAVAEVLVAHLEGPRDRLWVGVEVLVDRGADDDDHALGLAHDGGVGRGDEAALGPYPTQDVGSTRLAEGQLAGVDQRRRLTRSGRRSTRSRRLGERDRERQPDVATPADDRDVTRKAGVLHSTPLASQARRSRTDR